MFDVEFYRKTNFAWLRNSRYAQFFDFDNFRQTTILTYNVTINVYMYMTKNCSRS